MRSAGIAWRPPFEAREKCGFPSDPIALVIPKRNVETWIFHFDGQPVDEQTDYSDKTLPARGARRAAEGLIELTHSSSLPKDCLDSVAGYPRIATNQTRLIQAGWATGSRTRLYLHSLLGHWAHEPDLRCFSMR